jgi:geranylgeranyl diphosphate synthase, type I
VSAQPSAGAGAYAASLTQGFEAALVDFVEHLESHRELVEYAVRVGHRTRPVGCLLACGAVGGDWREALPVAIGVELLHKSSVIRDDIVDGDEMRSGQPAFHAVHGIPAAVSVSDRLWTVGLTQIAEGAPPQLSFECLRVATDVVAEMAAGQLEDIVPSGRRRGVQSRAEVEEQKTGSLAGLACRLGALVGGGTTGETEALTDFGRKIGTAFQVLNDMRNLAGEEVDRLAASDVRKRRDTVLSAYAYEIDATGNPPGSRDLSDSEVEQARGRLLAQGALQFGESLASRLLDEARTCLEVLPPTDASAILDSLTRETLRDHAF